MQDRRSFLKNAGAITLGSLIFSPFDTQAKRPEDIGLQLYTLRDALEQNLTGTLEKVAAIGYKNLESAMGKEGHYYGRKPKAFKALLKELGLKLRSSHVLTGISQGDAPVTEYATLTHGLTRLVDEAAETGQAYLVCAWLAPHERKTLDDYIRLADLFNKAGEACKNAGLQFAYHNHDFEFQPLEGKLPYDLLLAETDPELVRMELDLYWIKKAGYDPLAYFQRYPGRFPLWHVKDMEKGGDHSFTEVGRGVIDFKSIFSHARQSGMEYFFVEQDISSDPLQSITTSYSYLSQMTY